MKSQTIKGKILATVSFFIFISSLALAFSGALSITRAETLSDLPPVNVSDPGFKLIVCNSPVIPEGMPRPADYVPCDFNALMRQAQHFINIAIVAGVLVAVFGFCYAGFLLIKGNPTDRNKARDIFKNVFIGFIIMLSAWFIVYQILDWLTGNSGFSALLGSPR